MSRLLPIVVALFAWGCDECVEDFDCNADKICRSGVCERLVCSEDRACPPGRTCSENRCREVAPQVIPSVDALLFSVVDAGP